MYNVQCVRNECTMYNDDHVICFKVSNVISFEKVVRRLKVRALIPWNKWGPFISGQAKTEREGINSLA